MARESSPSSVDVIGQVLAVTPSGRVTVRAESSTVIPEGSRVRGKSVSLEGTVVKVFGPVRRPFYSVRPVRPPRLDEAARWIGATVLGGR